VVVVVVVVVVVGVGGGGGGRRGERIHVISTIGILFWAFSSRDKLK